MENEPQPTFSERQKSNDKDEQNEKLDIGFAGSLERAVLISLVVFGVFTEVSEHEFLVFC